MHDLVTLGRVIWVIDTIRTRLHVRAHTPHACADCGALVHGSSRLTNVGQEGFLTPLSPFARLTIERPPRRATRRPRRSGPPPKLDRNSRVRNHEKKRLFRVRVRLFIFFGLATECETRANDVRCHLRAKYRNYFNLAYCDCNEERKREEKKEAAMVTSVCQRGGKSIDSRRIPVEHDCDKALARMHADSPGA